MQGTNELVLNPATMEEAMQYWRASSQAGPTYQKRLLTLLGPQLPAEALLELAHGRLRRRSRTRHV